MDVIKKIVETEKNSETLVNEAKQRSAEIVAAAEAETADALRKVRTEERDRINTAVKAEEAAAREAEAKAVTEVEKRYSDAASGSSAQIELLADKVAGRLLQTVFDQQEG